MPRCSTNSATRGRNFALARVFGVEHRGADRATVGRAAEELDVNFAKSIGPDYWEKRKNVFDFKQDVGSFLNRGRMPTYVGANSVTFKGPAVRVAANEPGGPGRRHPAGQVGECRQRRRSREWSRTPIGRGRVVYFAGGFDAAYYLYAYPYQRFCWPDAIDWAASGAAADRRRGADVRAFDPDAAVEGRLGAADRPPVQRPQYHGLPRAARMTTCRSARRSCRSMTSGSRSHRAIDWGGSTSSRRVAT